jgi:hypothetical protein
VSGGPNWLPWRRDWSRYPNVWKVYVAYTVVFVAAAAFYLAAGSLFGVFWVCLAVATAFLTRFVYRRSRPGWLASGNDEPH